MTPCRRSGTPSRVLVAAAVAATVACSGGSPQPPGAVARSSAARITTPAPPGDVAAVVASGTDLGLDLYRRLIAAQDGNLAFSPHSISLALAMAYAGSATATQAAFEHTMRVPVPESSFHRAMNDLGRQLASRGQGAKATNGQPFRLDITNQLFANVGTPFVPAFLDTLAQEYGSDVRLLDFASAPDPSRAAINTWVDERTGGHIRDLLPDGSVTRDTRAVLVNAIYFDAAWATQFNPAQTHDAPFHLLDGSTASVRMMSDAEHPARAAQVDGVEVVALPYDGQQLSMVLLMPPAGTFGDFELQLTASRLDAFIAAVGPETLALSMPRFDVRTEAPLRQPLADLGLTVAFTDAADFSRMSPEPLEIYDVLHQALVIVDENGTVAAAATSITFGPTALPVARPVVLDRPFVYLIRDDATGAVLFLGRLVRP